MISPKPNQGFLPGWYPTNINERGREEGRGEGEGREGEEEKGKRGRERGERDTR